MKVTLKREVGFLGQLMTRESFRNLCSVSKLEDSAYEDKEQNIWLVNGIVYASRGVSFRLTGVTYTQDRALGKFIFVDITCDLTPG